MHSKKSFRVNTSSSRAATPAKKFSTNEELAARADLPPTQIAEFREIFRLIDTDGSDTLSLAELKNLLENLHFDTMQLEDEFYMDLLGKVKKNKQRAPLVAATPGGRKNAAAEKAYFHEVTVGRSVASHPLCPTYVYHHVTPAVRRAHGGSVEASSGCRIYQRRNVKAFCCPRCVLNSYCVTCFHYLRVL